MSKFKFSLLSQSLALAVLSLAMACYGLDPNATPAANYGQLEIKNGKLSSVNTGSPVQLMGMSLYWSDWGSAWWNESAVDQAVDYLGCRVIRAPLAVGDNKGDDLTGYLYFPDQNKARLERVVNEAIYKGIYVIIDWHDSMAENPSHTAASVDFFKQMAREYGNVPNVLFEIYNEPVNSDWDTAIKPYAETVIKAIRETPGPDGNPTQNVIIVGTPNFSQFNYKISGNPPPDPVVVNPITDYPNIAYTFHFYTGTHTTSLRNWVTDALNAGLPVIVTEWGVSNADGSMVDLTADPTYVEDDVQPWVDWMKDNQISWCNFSLFDKDEGASIFQPGTTPLGPWTDAALTSFDGNYVKSILPIPLDALVVSPSLLSFPYQGGAQSTTMTTTETWTASSNSSWLNFQSDTSSGGIINVTADLNTSTSPRTGTIEFSGSGGHKAHIVVSQEYDDGNLAKHKTVWSSPVESSGYPASAAVDGDEVNTRWSSQSGPAWITVDLGDTYTIGAVKLLWETAYSKNYHIQLSSDTTDGSDGNWTSIFDSGAVASGLGPHTDIMLISSSLSGRYIRMYSEGSISSSWGNSLYEFEVFGAGSSGAITASPLSWTLAANGGSGSILISSNGTWTAASSDTSWLTVTPASATGTGSAALTFVVSANTNGTGSSRTGTVTLSGPNGAKQIVTVIQPAAVGMVLIPIPTTLTLSGDAGQQSIVVDSNIAWTVSWGPPSWLPDQDTSWLHLVTTNGTGNGVITFTYGTNTTEFRDGVITLQDAAGLGVTQSISISQPIEYITASPSAMPLTLSGNGDSGSISVAADMHWTASSDSTWLTITPASGSGNGTLTAYVNTNGTGSARVGHVTITSVDGFVQAVVEVDQAAATGNVVMPAVTSITVPATGGAQSVAINSNIAWSDYTSDAGGWLHLTTYNGNGNGTLSFNVDANTGAQRSGTITVQDNSGSGAPSQKVTITQLAH